MSENFRRMGSSFRCDFSEEELIAMFTGKKEKIAMERQLSNQAKSPLKTQLSIDKVPGVVEEEKGGKKKVR